MNGRRRAPGGCLSDPSIHSAALSCRGRSLRDTCPRAGLSPNNLISARRRVRCILHAAASPGSGERLAGRAGGARTVALRPSPSLGANPGPARTAFTLSRERGRAAHARLTPSRAPPRPPAAQRFTAGRYRHAYCGPRSGPSGLTGARPSRCSGTTRGSRARAPKRPRPALRESAASPRGMWRGSSPRPGGYHRRSPSTAPPRRRSAAMAAPSCGSAPGRPGTGSGG